MGPKKDAKAAEEAPKEPQPEPQPFQLVGYGRFEYLNGVVYEGNWKIVKGIKVKQGYGKMILPNQLKGSTGEQFYEGTWQQDKMHGFGEYHYPDGGIYSGEWSNNQQSGRGRFQFANGTIYEGGWKNHLMHGSGVFTDHLGRNWTGEYREGVYESRKQTQLVKENIK